MCQQILALIVCLIYWSVYTKATLCNSGWFGPGCRFKCMCSNFTCAMNGSCLPGQKCIVPNFGYLCQYVDRARMAKIAPRFITDGNDNTCNNNTEDELMTITFETRTVFTFLQIVFKKVVISFFHLKYNIVVSFKDGSIPGTCENQRILELDNRTAEIRCSNILAYDSVILQGQGVQYICSVFISEGRNFAIKRETETIPSSRKRVNAVDGDPRSCIMTYRHPLEHGDFQWIVSLPKGFYAHRIKIVNVPVTDSGSLKEFNLTLYTWDIDTPISKLQLTRGAKGKYTITFTTRQVISKINLRVPGHRQDEMNFCEFEIYGDCVDDKYGLECDQTSVNCESGTFDIDGVCFLLTEEPNHLYRRPCTGCLGQCDMTGECQGVCATGYKGTNCLEGCTNCIEENPFCNRTTGECYRCQEGFYGPTCTSSCGHCTSTHKCDTTDGTCPWGCKPGFTGEKCDEECWNCAGDGSCFRANGHCVHGCKDGYRGGACVLACHNCAGRGTCERIEGMCDEGCIDGFHGLDCSYKCGFCHNGKCNRIDGKCESGCKHGYKGDRCDTSCDNCLNESCNAVDEKCLLGCKPGFAAVDCETSCPNCNVNDKSCDQKTRYCLKGCKPGFFEDDCSNICDTCGGDRSCHRKTGDCIDGCKDGFTGVLCKDLIDEGDRGASENIFYGLFISTVTLLTIYIACYPFLLKLKRKPKRHGSKVSKSENHASQVDEPQDNSEKFDVDP
ncbi:hypothetical protein Btru_014004 [Bulinus truncatus]|nr:hypothetical protein Btru_014004 [Bulinus truncatus]